MTLATVFTERLSKMKNEPVKFHPKTASHFFNLLLILVKNDDRNAKEVKEKMKKELQSLCEVKEGEEKTEIFIDETSKSHVDKILKVLD